MKHDRWNVGSKLGGGGGRERGGDILEEGRIAAFCHKIGRIREVGQDCNEMLQIFEMFGNFRFVIHECLKYFFLFYHLI